MSGLEAWAAVGLVANVVQIIGFTGEVVDRLKWCFDKAEDAPRVVKEIIITLPALKEILEKAGKHGELTAPNAETKQAFEVRLKNLEPLVKSCDEDLKKMEAIIKEIFPEKTDGKRARLGKAVGGLINDSKLNRINARIKTNVEVIKQITDTNSSDFLITLMKEMKQNVGPVTERLAQLSQEMQGDVIVPMEVMKDVVNEMAKDQSQNQVKVVDMLDSILLHLRKNEEVKPSPARQDIQKAFNNIPSARKVGEFVRRPKISIEIENRFALPTNTKQTVVLQGMGGNGKTQLAMDFASKALEKKLYDSVFWVDATSEASAQRSFQEIAEKLTHPAPKFENDKMRIEFVERKLKEWNHEFLVIFDNYDDVSAFEKHRLPEFMPHCGLSHFLITSRLSPLSQDIVRLCANNCVIEVGGMEESEAVELLVRRAFREPPDPGSDFSVHAKRIVKRLGYHALAIDLSAAYILEREKPLDQFLDEFDKRTKVILSTPPDSPLWEYQKRSGDQEQATNLAVFASWQLSYNLLRPEDGKGKVSAYLLNLVAFLYKQGVSEDLFWHQSSQLREDEFPEWLEFFVDDDDQWDKWKFEDAVKDLRKLSLISSYDPKGDRIRNITLHPLVKDWIKMRLDREEQRIFTVEATNIVHRFLKSQKSSVETFEMGVELKAEALSYVVVCQENLAEFCKGQRGKDPKRLGEGELAEAGETFALFLEYMGKISEGEALFKTLIKWRASKSNPEDRALLRAKSLFTEILRLQKNFREAEKLDREVYDVRRSLLGEDVALDEAAFQRAGPKRKELMKETLWSAHDLGWDLEALGDVEEAEKLQRIAYDGRKQVLGQNNPLTLQSVNNLAHTLRRQGKTLEALSLMKETLQIGREIFPTTHHSELLQFMSNLQDVLRFQGQLEEAEAMARESYDATCKEWGIDHLKAAASRGQLKDILWDRNKAEEAEKVATDNLEIMAKSPYSTDISRIDDIALLLDTLSGRQMTDGGNRRNEILEHANRAFALVEKLPPDDLCLPSTLQDLIYLSTGLEVLRASEQLTKLEPIIYEHCKKVFGISDRNTINSLVRYSSALTVERKKDEAERHCQSAIEELRTKLDHGETHRTKSTHLAALSWLAVLYKHIGDQRSAMEVYDKAFDYVMKGDFISEADYETLYSIQGLAEDIDDQRRCQKAEILHKAVLKTRENRYNEHPCVDDSLYAYSWNLRLQDRLEEAEKVCTRALDIARKFRGPHRNTMCILKRLAYLEEQLGKHEEAEKHYREVLSGFRALGTRHMTRVTEALEDLQELLMEQRKWGEARALIQNAMVRREQGWDRNMGHYAGLIRHLAIVTWEIGDGVEGLRLYRKARRTYEEAWGLHKMKEGRAKRNLILRINELLPGTENMEEEMRIEAEQAAEKAVQDANDAAAQKNAELEAADDGQKTPTAVQDVKLGLGQVERSLASHVAYDGKTQQYQMTTKSNEEAAASNFDAGDVSLSRSSTLGVNSFPEAPDNEPSKINNQSTVLDEATRRMEQASLYLA